jgi:exodeoxyribonuclease V gamma subunit
VGVTVVTGHRLEELFAALLDQLESSPAGPMATETILVPGQGIARWLELRIADQLGIAAGIEMPFLGAYLHRLSAGGNTGSGDLFSREVLVLRLWRLISERLHSPDAKIAFGAATDYCKRDEDGRKRLQLCTRLAACFDDYQLYRDDLLTDFSKGDDHKALSPHAPWQGRIWRALLEDAGLSLPSPRTSKAKAVEATPFLFAEMADAPAQNGPSSESAHRLVALRTRLNDSDWCRDNLPPRLSVFGTTTMPPAFLDVLHHVAKHIPVHLYVPQPTPHYVGDLRERKNRTGDNALLARFGTESREFQTLLVDLEERAATGPSVERLDLDEIEETAPPSTLLGCLQHDIVHAFDRGERTAERHQLSLDDASLRVHDCHSAQRELEVVRDQIFAALEDDASLQARDILVLVPDIDRYAPYAHAVFGPVQYNLPFHVADRHPARELPICRSLLSVLELASTRLTLADVLHLLENTAVQRRFGLFPTDVPVLRHLCQAAGIRWGLDGESRHEQFDLPSFDDNAWRQGIDRLLMGTLTGPVDDLVLGTLPVGDTTESRADLLAKFVTFSRTLFAQVAVLRHPHAFEDWADRVDAVADALFTATDGDQEDALRQLKRATISLRSNARAAEHNEPVTLAVLRDWLHDALAQGAPSRGFLGGSITIAAMLPMRAVPVRCLFVCGLDDDSFPRRDKPAPFDLMVAKPRPGDRNRRLDDRQLFLDLLLAARDRLHLSYVGRSAKDNAEGAPSVVLAELFDHVDRTCLSSKPLAGNQGGSNNLAPHKQLVVQHPLQPWSERYRDGSDQRLFTYAREATLAQPATGLRDEQQPWCPEELDIGPASDHQDNTLKLALDDLLMFWWHPCRAFLRETLRVRVRSDDESEEADEPFSLDALTRYQLQDEAVRNAQRGDDDPDDPLQWTRAKGVLPVGSHGEATYQALRAETHQLVQEARRYATTTSRRIDVTFGKTHITGTIDGFSDRDLAYMRVSKIKPKDRLKAWLLHLVVTMQRLQDGDDHKPTWPSTTRVLASNGTWIYNPVPEAVAREQFELLLTLYHTGKRRPLPFFERCSFAVCEKLNKSNDEVKAMRQGTKDYAVKDPSDPWKYDEGDASIALCMRDRDPFEGGVDSEFFRLAKAIWVAPISYLQEQN